MPDRYYKIYHKNGHDIYLHETEQIVRVDMSQPPAHDTPVHSRGDMCLKCVDAVREVFNEAERILKTPRDKLAILEGERLYGEGLGW